LEKGLLDLYKTLPAIEKPFNSDYVNCRKPVIMKHCLAFVCLLFVVTSCKKDDNPPIVEVFGKNPDSVFVKTYAEYMDPGAKATDPEDGPVELIVAKNVNMNVPGHYLIFYSAKDKYDNVSEKKQRDVYVIKADGTYSANESCSSSGAQSLTVTISSNYTNDTISLKDFPVALFTTKAVTKEGGYQIYQQQLNGVIQIEGAITVDHSSMTISYTRTSLVGPPASENCTVSLTRN